MVRAMRGAQSFISGSRSPTIIGSNGTQWSDGFILNTTLGLPDVRNRTVFSVLDPNAGMSDEDLSDDEALLGYEIHVPST